MKKSTFAIYLFLISICMFSCKENYSEINLEEVTAKGSLLYLSDDGFKMMMPRNYETLTKEKFYEKLDKLNLDSTSYNYQEKAFMIRNGDLQVYHDTSNIFNFIAIINPKKYLSLIPSNISKLKKGTKESMLKIKDLFPELIYEEISKSKIQIDEPFKYFKYKYSVQLKDWKRYISIYLKVDTKIRKTVIVLFANQDESKNFDNYITSLKFLKEE